MLSNVSDSDSPFFNDVSIRLPSQDHLKFGLCGYRLTLYHKILTFKYQKTVFLKLWKQRKCWVPAFSPFSHDVFMRLPSQDHLKFGLCGYGLTLYDTIPTFNNPKNRGFFF